MKIVVINPNSSEEMTSLIRSAAESYADRRFEVVTVPTPGASKFIGTFEDMAKSAPGMCEIVRRYESEADAFVVACGRDPNLKLMRELTDKPVVGIAQSAIYMASMLGDSFTILQTDSYTVPNKIHVVEDYHMEGYLASVRDSSVEAGDRFAQYLEAGRKAIAEDGAEVIILGCAGLCDMARKLSEQLGVPVLDGVVCGLATAEAIVRLGFKTSKARYYSAGRNG